MNFDENFYADLEQEEAAQAILEAEPVYVPYEHPLPPPLEVCWQEVEVAQPEPNEALEAWHEAELARLAE